MSTPINELYKCQLCDRSHALRYCRQFIAMNPNQRDYVVRIYGYCRNCLARSHTTESCVSSNSCKECGLEHHTMLHPEDVAQKLLQESSRRSDRKMSNKRRPTRRDTPTAAHPSCNCQGASRFGTPRQGNVTMPAPRNDRLRRPPSSATSNHNQLQQHQTNQLQQLQTNHLQQHQTNHLQQQQTNQLRELRTQTLLTKAIQSLMELSKAL